MAGTITTPNSVEEAVKHEAWLKATVKEMKGHIAAGTYRIVGIPPGRKLIYTKVAYMVRRNGTLKARWCGRGEREVY
jgi:hypothetical protein